MLIMTPDVASYLNQYPQQLLQGSCLLQFAYLEPQSCITPWFNQYSGCPQRCRFLKEVSQTEPQVFICHFYNTYFAHTAGGRMIGSKVSQMILDNKQLNFYKYDGEVKELLSQVRDNINQVRMHSVLRASLLSNASCFTVAAQRPYCSVAAADRWRKAGQESRRIDV